MTKKIYILNFEEYNPRKDVKRHSWFRVDNTIAFSKKLHKLTAAQKWFWICLISFASSEQRDWTEVDLDYWAETCKISVDEINEALNHFADRKMISFEAENSNNSVTILNSEITDLHDKPKKNTCTNVDVTATNAHERARSSTCPTYIRTDVTDDTDVTNSTVVVGNNSFEIAEGFKNEPVLKQVLPYISTMVQENWLKRYEKEWITQVLIDAVQYYLNETNKKPSEINDWGRKLVGWVKRQKKPILGGSVRNPVDEFCDEMKAAEKEANK